MLAVLVLVVVILAAGRIFSTVSTVTSISVGLADVLTEAAAIEQQLRRDFENLAPDGFFAIRCVAVPNDVNVLAGGPMLNPDLRPDAMIRADQLLYFTNTEASTQRYIGSGDILTPAGGLQREAPAQGTVSRVYFGHGFQLMPEASEFNVSIDPAGGFNSGQGVFPWSFDPVAPDGSLDVRSAVSLYAPLGPIDGTQPEARRWLLARQAVMLADDGIGFTRHFLTPIAGPAGVNAADSIWGDLDAPLTNQFRIRNGRADIAASQINNVRGQVQFDSTTAPPAARTWDQQRDRIGDAMPYPRVERTTHSMRRVDQLLTTAALGSACSSIVIDWTYDHRTGESCPSDSTVTCDQFPDDRCYCGVFIDSRFEQPWFGLDPVGDSTQRRGVTLFAEYLNALPANLQPDTIFAPLNTPDDNQIERYNIAVESGGTLNWFNMLGTGFPFTPPGSPDVLVYEAYFGYNQRDPLVLNGSCGPGTAPGIPDSQFGVPAPCAAFTPWPSAIRITMTLHDPNTKLKDGREVQFVLRLPRRSG